MDRFTKQIERFVLEEKTEGKGRIGIFCPYAVVELIDAGNFVPVRLIPRDPTIRKADGYLPNSLCSYLRHIVDLAMRGELQDFSCILFNHSCDGSRRAYDVFRSYLGEMPSIFVDIPKKNDELSAWYFYEELKRIRQFFEELSHTSITDSALSKSIERYNENRQLLRELYELRARFPSLLNSEIMISVLDANVILSKERANALLRSLCDDIQRNASTGHEKVKKKVFVSGNIFDALPLLRFIEECGGQITGDDFCFGGRYAQTHILDTDPLYALAQGYLKKMPCGRMEDYSRRFDFIIEEMQKHSTRGLIYSSLKFCDNFLVDYPALKEKLDGLGIPSLFIEGEYFSLNTGQIKTRIEAFIEML